MPGKIYNLFLSHSWSHSDHYERLVALLREARYFHFKDYSVPRDDPIHGASSSRALYKAIKKHMAPCHVVLVLAGVYATYSSWIRREIRIAKLEFARPKPIIAVRPRGNEKISRIVARNADEVVGWNTESIVSAIRRWAQ